MIEISLKEYLLSLGFNFYYREGYDLIIGDKKYNIRVLHDISTRYVFIITDLLEDIISHNVLTLEELIVETELLKKIIRKHKIKKILDS